jgi:S-adenosylmethionine:tRNA ribosyltransferase-isomerase
MTPNLTRSDFTYTLPPELIAKHPVSPRSSARLLHVAADGLHDCSMMDLPQCLHPADLMVFNDTKVIKARLIGAKPTGGRCEVMIERVLSDTEVLAQLGVSKKPAVGGAIIVADGAFVMQGREGDLFQLRWQGPGTVWQLMERAGSLPLPPYFERAAEAADDEHYQTLWASKPGAVAAPTASLHFDEALLAALRTHGIGTAQVTLHVGAGTFQPVRVENLADHVMHAERYEVPPETQQAIAHARAAGGRVIAVGTTVCRALESWAATGEAGGDTRLFITPGYRFRVIDRLLTNFHLPESTLLMLVSAFGGLQRLRAAYDHAIAGRYRFYSYGDAMLIEPAAPPPVSV